MLNLIVNARDDMAQGGKIRIETSNQEVTDSHVLLYPGIHPGPFVRLAIHDSGAGMPPAVKARLFEPFFTTKPPGKGTGLGLATVHGIVKQHGGGSAESSPGGRGALRRRPVPAEAAAPAPPPPRDRPTRSCKAVLAGAEGWGGHRSGAAAPRGLGYRVV